MSQNIPYGRQEITAEDIQAVIDTLKSDFLTQGPEVEKFEKAFAQFSGAKHAVAVNNATAALHLCTMTLDLKPGQKVLCTPNTFVASANCVLYCGADVEFIDIDPETFCMDLDLLEEKLAKAPKGSYVGVVAVDFAGYPMDFSHLRKIADQYGLWLIEDAAHAPGAEFRTADGKWHRAGNGEFAELTVFSFHPVKHIATGEGGMVTTNSDALAKKLRLLRSHGITKDSSEFTHQEGGWYHEMQALGMNFRIPDILCTLGLSQLKRIDENLRRRREIASRYDEAFKNLPLKSQKKSSDVRNAFHLYVIQTEKRKALYEFLKTKDIYSQVHYIPIYQQPYYVQKYGPQSLKNADRYYSQALSLPMFHRMTDADQEKVIQAVKDFFHA
ncbi:MAG: UDP-4-amino-4,6-dideoxy-N-acetyl-beta-L-altrosamine transaminase [Pseudobdellovibrionaceae bacterium]